MAPEVSPCGLPVTPHTEEEEEEEKNGGSFVFSYEVVMFPWTQGWSRHYRAWRAVFAIR